MSEYLILFPDMCMLMQDVFSSLDLEICADVASLWCQAWPSKMHRRLQMRVCMCRRRWGCHRDIWARLRSCLVMMIHICHVEMSKYWWGFFFWWRWREKHRSASEMDVWGQPSHHMQNRSPRLDPNKPRHGAAHLTHSIGGWLGWQADV